MQTYVCVLLALFVAASAPCADASRLKSRHADKIAAMETQFKNEVLWHRKIKQFELELQYQIQPRAKYYLRRDTSALAKVEESYWTSAVGLRQGLDFHCYQSFHAPGIVISNTAELAWWYQLDAGVVTHAPKAHFANGKNIPTDGADMCAWKPNPRGEGYKSLITQYSDTLGPTACQWVRVSKTKSEVAQQLSEWKRTGTIPGFHAGHEARYSEAMLHYKPDEILAVSVEFVPVDTTSGVPRNIILYAMQLRASLKILAGVDVPYVHVDSSSGVPVLKFFSTDDQMLVEADKVPAAKKATLAAKTEFPKWVLYVKAQHDAPSSSPSQLYKPVHGGYPGK